LTVSAATVVDMTHDRDFDLNRPGALIAALPAVLGFVPEKSLVLVSVQHGELGAVMRADLDDLENGQVEHLARVAAGSAPEAAIAVIVDDAGAKCPMCNEDYRQVAGDLRIALEERDIELWAVHVVDRIESGGRWHCVDGCGSHGRVDDPSISPVAVAAVVEGRRLYRNRSDLQAVIAADPKAEVPVLTQRIDELEAAGRDERAADPDGCTRRGVSAAIAAAERLAGGSDLSDADVAELGYILTDVAARDTLYALAVGREAGRAEELWAVLARRLPPPWRVEALVLLAFSAYARGDGPLAGVSLDAAIRSDPAHRMAGMLDAALQAGMRPERIRELAVTGYRLAKRLGLQLPPRRYDRRQAG